MIIEDIKIIARQAGEIMTLAKRPKVMEKAGHANFCTETDEKIQRFLIEKLKEILPEAEFLGEEDGQDIFTAKMKHGFCFVLDPIDGTSNFIYAYRPSVVSIALLKEGKPYIGVVYNPYDDMMFAAEADKGAYMNDEKIMSADTPLSESLALFGTAPYYTELQEKTFDIARQLLPQCVDLRRSGTAAWDMCCVAMGICNLYFELKIQLWDYAAAALIAQEAGCTVTDTDGNSLSYTGFSSVICRARGVKEIPECLKNKKTVKVVAAIICDDYTNKTKIFATQRGYGEFKDGWEFPGGKIEEGESPKQALVREIREELGAEIEVHDLIDVIDYDYEKFHLHMNCYWATVADGQLRLLEHEDARWLIKDEIGSVDWLPADLDLLPKIAEAMTDLKTT